MVSGRQRLATSGLGSDTTSLKDVVDQLKITNELLTQIDTDLRPSTSRSMH